MGTGGQRAQPNRRSGTSAPKNRGMESVKLATFLHIAFPIGDRHLFFDGWIGAPIPEIASVIIDYPSGSVTTDSFECAYFERPDLERVRQQADPALRFLGYRLVVQAPKRNEQPTRVVLILNDGKRLGQALRERYTTDMSLAERHSYLQTAPYPVQNPVLENAAYVASVLRICREALAREGTPQHTSAHTEQICCTLGGRVLICGWLSDEGHLEGPVRVKGNSAGEGFRGAILRFSRTDLTKLGTGAMGFALFLETNGRRIPSQLALESGSEASAQICTENSPVVSGISALRQSLSVLRHYLATRATLGYEPTNDGQRLALDFIANVKQQLSRPVAVANERCWGALPSSPAVTLVIPVYRSYYLVRSQLLDLSRNAFLQDQEILIVLDSSEDRHWFTTYLDQLWELYRLPVRLLVMEHRSGFAGASNAGARAARASRLLFLNPDVFLGVSGSLEHMVETLDSDERIGGVGARLLFPDGSLQHSGMTWKRNPSLGGLRLNDHFFKGVDPASVPLDGVAEVPAVTAACMLCRADDFNDVGGFDEGFLWGDFEDSDLCLKLRQLGKRIVCDNDAIFIHAEGTSYSSEERRDAIGFNALRHERRWHREISTLMQSFRS